MGFTSAQRLFLTDLVTRWFKRYGDLTSSLCLLDCLMGHRSCTRGQRERKRVPQPSCWGVEMRPTSSPSAKYLRGLFHFLFGVCRGRCGCRKGARVWGGWAGRGRGRGRGRGAQGVAGEGVGRRRKNHEKIACNGGGIVRLYIPFSRLCRTARATISENGIRSNASRKGLDPEGMRQQGIACARRPSVVGRLSRGGRRARAQCFCFV